MGKQRVAASNEAHGKDFDLANAVDFSHFGLKGISESFAVVHLDVNLNKLEAEGQRFGLNGLNIVIVVSQGTDRLSDGVRVDVLEV